VCAVCDFLFLRRARRKSLTSSANVYVRRHTTRSHLVTAGKMCSTFTNVSEKTDRRWKKMFACARVVSNGATELWPLQTTSAINNHPAECHAWICVYARRGVSALACSHLSYITMLSFCARQAVYAPRADLIYGFCRVCVLYRCPISIYTPVHVCLKLG
jgi:hypothetical protein